MFDADKLTCSHEEFCVALLLIASWPNTHACSDVICVATGASQLPAAQTQAVAPQPVAAAAPAVAAVPIQQQAQKSQWPWTAQQMQAATTTWFV